MANVSQTFALSHPVAAPVKAKLSAGAWRKVVKAAHAAGNTVDSYLDPNTPAALKARTTASLKQQALTTINASYAPAEAELNSRASRIQSIDRKRASDNQYYNDWLKSKSDQLAGQINAHNSTLLTAGNQMHQATVDAYNQAHQNLVQDAQGTPGNISGDLQNAKAFDLGPQQQRGLGQVDTVRQQGLDTVAQNQNAQQFSYGQNSAQIAANESRRQNDTSSAVNNLFTDQQKLSLAKAGDAAKEVSRLLDNETTKAQNNRDYQAAAAQLGIKQDQLTLNQKTQADQNAVAQGNLKLAGQKLSHAESMDQFNRWQARQKINIAQQNADTSWYKATHNGKKPAVDPHATTRRAFDAAYSFVGGITRGKKSTALNTKYVQQNHDHYVALVMQHTKVNRSVAEAAVGAYETYKGGDPFASPPAAGSSLAALLNKIQKITGPSTVPH